jgi:transposase-like protein
MSILSLFGIVVTKKRKGRLHCPMCEADELGIRQLTGLEILISSVTDTRKYRCFSCHHEFRARDRRKGSRVTAADPGAVRRPA